MVSVAELAEVLHPLVPTTADEVTVATAVRDSTRLPAAS